MARYVAPLLNRKTFSEAVGSAIPTFLQAQAQQRQIESQENARLDEAARARAKLVYDQQKANQKLERDRRSELMEFDTSNLSESQLTAVKMMVDKSKSDLDSSDEEWMNSLQGVSELIDLFNNTEEVYDERETDFAEYALAGKSFADKTMVFNGDQEVLNEYNSIRSKGGFEDKDLEFNPETNKLESCYLGPDGNRIADDSGGFLKGPISKAPYYLPEHYTALYNVDANLQPRNNVAPADFLLGLESKIEIINDNASLSSDEKKRKLADMMRSGFSNRENSSDLFKTAYYSAINNFKQKNTLDDKADLDESQINEAIEDYIEEATNLYQPTQSLIEQELGFASYADERASKIVNQINSRTDLSRDEKALEVAKRIRNVFYTGEKDADKRARATAKNIWLENNTGAEYNEDEAFSDYLEKTLDYLDAYLKESSGDSQATPSRTDISKASERQSVFDSGDFGVFDLESINPEVMEVSNVVLSSGEAPEVTSFSLATFKGKVNASDYLPQSLSRETRLVTDYNNPDASPKVEFGEYKNMNSTPTNFSVFLDDNNNKIVRLSKFSDRNIPPIFINITNDKNAKSSINQLLESSYGKGLTLDKMFEAHSKELLNQ